MNKSNKKWALLAGVVFLLALIFTGNSITSLLPIAFLIACPVMMLFMHGGHGGHGGGHGNEHGSQDRSSSNLPER